MTHSDIDFTIAIPTYNGANRLPRILDRLRSQLEQTKSIQCELIVIDNNSTDQTFDVIKQYQKDYPVPLQYYQEIQQGSAFARQRAVREANSQLIGFLDDDNLPAANWITSAYSFAELYPKAGAYGGQIHGELEGEPPPNFDKIKLFLSIREHGTQPQKFDPDNLYLPTAASLVVRKKAWQESVPKEQRLKGRLGNSLVGGEDYEILLYLHKNGWEIWYNPAMESYHQIPAWRLEKNYLLTLSRGCGLATCQLRMINAKAWQKPIILIRNLLGNFRRIISQYLKYRSELKTNLTANVEMEFYWGSLLSTFYYIRNSLTARTNL